MKPSNPPARNILHEIAGERTDYLADPAHHERFPALAGTPPRPPLSETIRQFNANTSRRAVIAELKPASPTLGAIQLDVDVPALVSAYERGGACGISVLTEPTRFRGSFANLRAAATTTRLPLVMKDFLVHPWQVTAGARCGASNALVIVGVTDLPRFLPLLTSASLEPLVEVHSERDVAALGKTRPGLVGVNNRDLTDLSIDFATSKRLIPRVRDLLGDAVVVVSESGIHSREDVDTLYSYGADAFLVGSALMQSPDVERQLRELVEG